VPYLAERGFTAETVERVGWHVDPIGARARRYGLPAEAADAPVWFIPYRVNGRTSFERVRLLDGRFKGGKYRQPAGTGLRLYDPFGWLTRDEPLDGILVVEGEANAVSVAQALPDLPVVGLPGHNALDAAAAKALAHFPVVWLWFDLHEQGADRALRSALRHLRDAGVGDVRPIGATEGDDANDILRRPHARAVYSFLLDEALPAVVEDDDPVDRTELGARIEFVDVAQMLRFDPKPVKWLVDGIAVKGALSMLAGQPGEGKSLLALAVASGVARGETTAGLRCRPGRVLILDAEQSQAEIHRRVRALGMSADQVEIAVVDGFDLMRDLDLIAREVDDRRPDLVVLDSYRSMWTGDENDPARVAPPLYHLNKRIAHRFGCAVLLLHHAGKGDAPYRGSTAIAGAIEIGLTLGRVREDSDRQRRHLDCWKCRPAVEPDRRWLRLDDDRPRGMVFVEPADAYEPGMGRPPVRAAQIRNQIVYLLREEGELPQPDIARRLDRTPKDGTVRRVLESLEAVGEVACRRNGTGANVWSWQGAKRPVPPVPEVGLAPFDETLAPHDLQANHRSNGFANGV
jgi:KaiC/GvpD/RAD55 family RecA-like ATPase